MTQPALSVVVCLRSRLMTEAVAGNLDREPDLAAEAVMPEGLEGRLRKAGLDALVIDSQTAEVAPKGALGSIGVITVGRRSTDSGALDPAITLPMACAHDDLVHGLRALRSGAADAATRPRPGPNRGRRSSDRQQWLTEREQTVVELLAAGRAAGAIAEALDVSVHTARTHVQNVLAKLDAHSQTDAVARARELGLLKGGPAEEAK